MSTPAAVPRTNWRPGVVRALILLAIAALAVLFTRPASATAAVSDLTPPPDGCLAYDMGAVAMEDTAATQTLNLDLEGPVVQVIIEWAGIWQPAPLDPTIGVEVVGPGGTDSGSFAGTEATDATGLPVTPPATAYGYQADITDLFGSGDAGAYTVNVTPPVDGLDSGESRWGGATVTAVYDSSPCEDIATVIWKAGTDYYFGGNSTSSPTTELIVYDWGYPLAEDYTASFATSMTGSDETASDCRSSSIWVATGAGTAPATTDDLVDDDGVPNAALGGVEGITNPFTPPNQPCPEARLTAPVVSFTPGNAGPEWALVQFDLLIPAGSTWAAFQLESPRDNHGHPGLPESGAWSGAGLLILPAFVPATPDIALEKTVLAGADATCPGVEGTDELVSGEVGAPVTYCFKITNTGDIGLLAPIALDDPDLGVTADDMTLVSGNATVNLEPGGELVYSYSSTITADLLNTATVTGSPVDQGAPVTDTNDAAVTPAAATPDIALEKTVLAGADATCPGVEGTDELVSGDVNTPVTYCFRVTNSGDATLTSIDLDDPDLGITDADMSLVSGDDQVPLEPGQELLYSYTSTIATDLLNTATATGYPEDGEPVTDTNDAEVQLYVITGSVTPFCEADAPYLGYDIETNAPGTATITFTGDGDSASVNVPVGKGSVLWPGAAVGLDGTGIDWPGWDQDAHGNWFENPDNPYTWARQDVQITVQVNPSTEPVTVSYPPGTPTCLTAPPPNQPPAPAPPPLAETGTSDPSGPAGLAAALALLGATLVLFSRSLLHLTRP